MQIKSIDEARAVLSGVHEDFDGEEIIRYCLMVGIYCGEDENSYHFVCWPFSDDDPVEEDYAFNFQVDKETGTFHSDNVPITAEEAKILYRFHIKSTERAVAHAAR